MYLLSWKSCSAKFKLFSKTRKEGFGKKKKKAKDYPSDNFFIVRKEDVEYVHIRIEIFISLDTMLFTNVYKGL